MPTPNTQITSKAAWIKQQSPDMPVKDLIALAKRNGISITAGQVYTARSEARREAKAGANAARTLVSREPAREPTAPKSIGGIDAVIRGIVREEIQGVDLQSVIRDEVKKYFADRL